ncbi:HIT domain-containing protein [Oceanicoccus sagamiensis]|uniref:HIT family protein n=1 Tax=Oceanicoccus sagamiensis TaxID=716816 RepID=A0A1X9NBU9_9GAMM|nr:HIT family protein [Oceanicoccus sagamiensis]ARN75076.1 HIT family protein [Oceanicoccus sagamiensis]
MFELHPQLAKDCVEVGDYSLSKVLLLNDSNYPWIILVPKRSDIREIFQLSEDDQRQLLAESSALSEAMAAHFNADKMNVAALGNMVPQLHLHHIVRYKNDASWPNPVWGAVAAKPYNKTELDDLLATFKSILSLA